MDCSLPVSSIYGIFQARILEGVAISFSRGSFLKAGDYLTAGVQTLHSAEPATACLQRGAWGEADSLGERPDLCGVSTPQALPANPPGHTI